ncbi:phospholipase A [Thauera sp.]|jgi:phospholipase A1|uniref:phospholipase A n=1 Tax=Thauera sp. TaxID=1905334 RepID=UPI001A3F5150|nr:phospholipase A [Thauera sp.]MBL8465935.1 phospholipase A [Thauera sp.]HRO35700.1 phospholipase A [Thauera sp.]
MPKIPFPRSLLLAGALALTAPAAVAADWLLASSSPQVVPGQRFEVVVIGDGRSADWPPRLPASIELPAGGPRIAVELVAIGKPVAGASQRRYFARWPMELTGVAALALTGKPSARVLLDAGAVASVAAAPTAPAMAAGPSATHVAAPVAVPAAVAPMAPVAVAPEEAAPVEPSGFGFHEPMYFLIGGRDPVSARFQFSFRYRVFDGQGVVAETIPVASGLYFGFTQTSLWDLQSESKPFRDSSFRPSLFYRFALDDPDKRGSLALSGGYEHESNGKEDMPSRSIDTLFARAEARLRLSESGAYLGIAPKAWTYLDREDNPDIARFRGHAELGVRLGRDDGWLFSTLIRRGTEGKMGTQYDLSYPIRRSVFSGVGAFVHLQAFKGYGETLLEYDENKEVQYRIGVSLVR